MTVVFLGAPGAGKGTHAGFVSKALGVPIVSTGNLLREAVRQGSPLGRQVKEIMDSGNLVPDTISIALMQEKLASEECKNGVLIDGFPRTIGQAQALDGIVQVDTVISLEAPDEVIIGRMAGRLTCPKCQASYHVSDHPPQKAGICDVCGTPLGVRDDDRSEVVAQRFKNYHALTEPIKAYYARSGKLQVVAGQNSVQDTQRLVFKALGLGEPT